VLRMRKRAMARPSTASVLRTCILKTPLPESQNSSRGSPGP
jgi:hypothetical protein